MKNLIKIVLTVVAVALLNVSCQEEYSLGESYTITQDQFTFDVTPGSDMYTYTITASISVDAVKYPYTYEIRYGDGGVTKDLSSTHEYIVYAGTYTAQCLVYTPNGDVLIKDKSIVITIDNDKLFTDDPESLQFALTGGRDNLEGKEWRLGPWTGMRNPDNRNDCWWAFLDPDATGGNATAIMDDVFTFKPNSVKPNGAFVHENNGDSFMNEALETYFPDGESGSFVTVHYNPPTDATWEITEEGGKKFLTIHHGFLGYATGPDDLTSTTYEVVSYTTGSIRLFLVSGWTAWSYELTCEVPHDPLTNNDSKTWVIDANNEHLQEVKDGLPDLASRIKGHMGLGPINSYTSEWWGAGPDEKAFDNTLASVGHGWTLYEWKIKFTSTGQLVIETAGEGYGRNALKDDFPYVWNNSDDMAFPFDGGNFTYTKANTTPYPKLTLSEGAFFGYYVGTQEYEIIYLSDTALAVVAHNTVEGQDWVFILCPEGEQ